MIAAFDNLTHNLIKYMCQNKRVEMRRGSSLKRTINCREKDCKWVCYLTMIGKIYKFLKNESMITSAHSNWLIMFHKGKDEHLEITNKLIL
jgi:hypothetical protein